MTLKAALPKAPRNTRWRLSIHGETLTLQLRRTGLLGRRTVLAEWTTPRLSNLAPDPVTGLRHVAKGLVRSWKKSSKASTSRPSRLVVK